MQTDVLSSALIQTMSQNLSVADLIRTAETLKQSGQVDSVRTLYASWVDHNPSHPLLYAVLFNYSVILTDLGQLAPAQECLERSISLNADFMPAYINLGRVYERQGQVGKAVMQWSAALARLAPVNGQAITYKTTALNQSARALEAANQDDAAENMLRHSLEIDPHQREVIQHLLALRQRQCEWPIVQPSERVESATLMSGMSPLSAAAYTDDPMLQLAMAWNYNRLDVGRPQGAMSSWPRATTITSDRLRIGYLCSDFREHALGYLLTEVPALHDRSKVEVFIYYCGPVARDPLHEHFKKTCDHWVDISAMPDAAAAQRIADDGIQIFVDLNGYTREARLALVAMRPAPVMVNWLGYPGTMASPYHHYIIADDWIIPPENEIYYSEKVLRLPCYQPSNRKRTVAANIPTRADAKLPEDAMVYCCFNGAHKITRFTFERWLMILAGVPGSVLWLLDSIESTNKRLREYAGRFGIAPERIIFAPKLANPFHLARYGLADLFLDTTPYGAHTTASDALWAGVPVLTLSGRSFASRVCGSLVRSAGMPEMVCTSPEDFVQRAVELGRDRSRLISMRKHLADTHGTCTLFDMPRLIERLEDLYQEMWSDFQNGQLPRPRLSNLDVYLEIGGQIKHDEMEVQSLKDYRAWWRKNLLARHEYRPIDADERLARDLDRPA